jgi:hypothetical protein
MLCNVMICYVLLSYVMLCYIMLYYVMLCYDKLYNPMMNLIALSRMKSYHDIFHNTSH